MNHLQANLQTQPLKIRSGGTKLDRQIDAILRQMQAELSQN